MRKSLAVVPTDRLISRIIENYSEGVTRVTATILIKPTDRIPESVIRSGYFVIQLKIFQPLITYSMNDGIIWDQPP